jgi:dipeptidyl aminopeptidase/acylaminoacyl peptidase
MTKGILFTIILSIAPFLHGRSQKKEIDFVALKQWETLGRYAISNDGRYVWYEHNTRQDKDSLILISADRKYRTSFFRGHNAVFSEDSKFLLYITRDTLHILQLETKENETIANVPRLTVPKKGITQWIAFNSKSEIILKNIKNGRIRRYPAANYCLFDNEGNKILLYKKDSLLLVNLKSGIQILLDSGRRPINMAFNKTGQYIAFLENNKKGQKILGYYDLNNGSKSILVTNQTKGIKQGFTISDQQVWFSKDGKNVFFKLLREKEVVHRDTNIITDKVKIWNFNDKFLISEQELTYQDNINRTYLATVDISSKDLIQLESIDSTILGESNNSYAIIKNITNDHESFWDTEQRPGYNLVSIKTGNQISFMPHSGTAILECLSPTEKYAIWRDSVTKKYYSYNITSQQTKCINDGINLDQDFKNIGRSRPLEFMIAGWLKNDQALILYDRYDIWLLDPQGKNKPIDITGGYGRTHKIMLRFALNAEELQQYQIGDSIWLAALEDNTKYNGFYKTRLTHVKTIKEGKLFAYLYHCPYMFLGASPAPIKAKNTSQYILTGESDQDSPNLFITRNFDFFAQLSHFAPQKAFNWMTAQLIHWKTDLGDYRYGILYKPENFDSTKKYPIIFHYYEMRSNERYRFQAPTLSEGGLNIPWYVSKGYIVFVPDIWQTEGKTGQSALTSVESAAIYLTDTFPWIDRTKMGLQGHSFGGFETNYIISHSNLFAAAQASAAPSDCVSGYGNLSFGGKSLAAMHEVGQMNLGAALWEVPDIYLENSPVFSVKRITTPLLLLHNRNDGAVPFFHSIELFTALRRLKKPCWLIEYEDQDHVLDQTSNCSIDFTIKQQQFFDHYLKGKAAPDWMTKGTGFGK